MYGNFYGNQNPMQGQMYDPYRARLESMQRAEIVRVNGEGGAMAYGLPPNSSALLLDENAPLVWLVQTDGAGYKTTRAYKIEPYQAECQTDTKTLEERIKRLEDIINGKPDSVRPSTE